MSYGHTLLKNQMVQWSADRGPLQMEGKGHDQRAYEKVKPHLPDLLLNIVLQAVEELRPLPVRPRQVPLVAVVNNKVRGRQQDPPPSGLQSLAFRLAHKRRGCPPDAADVEMPAAVR